MKFMLTLILLSVSACATTQGPLEVKIPIAVPCKTQDPTQPQYHYAPPYDALFDAVRDLLGDRELAIAYENEQRAALRSCK